IRFIQSIYAVLKIASRHAILAANNQIRQTVIPIPTQQQPELSIVIPCYNEADAIENVVRDWCTFLGELVGEVNYEILIVNDGSTDGTGRILDRIRKEQRCLRVIHQLNLGHDVAVRRGYDLARGRYVAQIDGNGRHEPTEFTAMWEKRGDYRL